MQITIKIDCETISEFYSHLFELKGQVKREAKKRKLNPLKDEFPTTVNLDDDNCYGSHTVKIKHDKP